MESVANFARNQHFINSGGSQILNISVLNILCVMNKDNFFNLDERLQPFSNQPQEECIEAEGRDVEVMIMRKLITTSLQILSNYLND